MKLKAFVILMLVIFARSAQSQDGYTVLKVQLPNDTQVKDYFVKKIGANYVLNGDIIIGSTVQRTAIYQSNNQGAAIWPRGEVPVQIDLSMYTNKLAENALRAIEQLNRLTRLRLVPHTGQKDYIRIVYSPDTTYGGLSPIGKRGGEQIIYITRVSTVRTVVHELLHSLGFWHEQSRYDRDNFIRINWNNIDSNFRHNFQTEPGLTNGPYDYNSIMHYSAFAFASNPNIRTIQCKNGNTVSDCTLGGSGMSERDIRGINMAYWFNDALPQADYRAALAGIQNLNDLANTQQSGHAAGTYTKTIADGKYRIRVNQTGKYLAIEGISLNNGARLVQWDYAEQGNHQFYVKSAGNGYYEISAVHSNRFLNAAGQAKNDGTPIIQWDHADQDNVKWRIYYSTESRGWVMENKGASPIRLAAGLFATGNGEPFILWLPKRQDAHDYEPNQSFSFEKIGELPDPMKKQFNGGGRVIQKMKN